MPIAVYNKESVIDDNEIKIYRGKIIISMKPRHRILREILRQRYAGYACSNSSAADISIHIDYSPKIKTPELDMVVDRSSSLEIGYSQQNVVIFSHRFPTLAWFDKDSYFSEIHVITQDLQLKVFSANFLDCFLNIFLLTNGMGFLCHACGVVDHGGGLLFLGPSGSGKSTIANLRGHRSLIGDDGVFVQKNKNCFEMLQITTMNNLVIKEPKPAVEIRKIFFLEKANKNFVKPLTKTAAFIKLMSYVSGISLGSNHSAKITDLILDLINGVNCYILYFMPDRKVWHFLSNL